MKTDSEQCEDWADYYDNIIQISSGPVRYLDSREVIGVIITSLPDIDLQLYNWQYSLHPHQDYYEHMTSYQINLVYFQLKFTVLKLFFFGT